MSIYDIRNQVELEQYTIRQAQVALHKLAEDLDGEDATVMLDVVAALLGQAYEGMSAIVDAMTQYGQERRYDNWQMRNIRAVVIGGAMQTTPGGVSMKV